MTDPVPDNPAPAATFTPRTIRNTDQMTRHPWPDDIHVQGGSRGVVFAGDEVYRTAFVEAFPFGTFLRGEGSTVAEAEASCWVQFERMAACPGHPVHGPFEARHYTNGAGFCTECGTWFSKVLPVQPEDPDREVPVLERALQEAAGVRPGREAVRRLLDAMTGVDTLPTRHAERKIV